ncbi:hypothetical protein SEA_SQUEE_5 [Mycobacterium phage Squee]
MAGMSLATTAFAKAAIGSTEIQKISIGDTLVWSASPALFHAISTPSEGQSTLSPSVTLSAAGTVLVPVSMRGDNTVTAITLNGDAMTHIVSIAHGNSGGNGYLRVYAKTGVPAGTASVSITRSGGAFGRAYAVAYTGVNTIGTPDTAFGTGTSVSHNPAAPPANGLVFWVLSLFQSTAITPSGGDVRGNYTGSNGSFAVLDASTDSTFSATLGASTPWSSAAIPLS